MSRRGREDVAVWSRRCRGVSRRCRGVSRRCRGVSRGRVAAMSVVTRRVTTLVILCAVIRFSNGLTFLLYSCLPLDVLARLFDSRYWLTFLLAA